MRASHSTGAAAGEARSQEEPPVPFEQRMSPVQFTLQIDATKLGAQEILEIARELRGLATLSTSDS